MVALLQRAGYTVYAPPNPLQGLSYDSATLADFLSTISGPIVLVGHSYGGMVITNVANGLPAGEAATLAATQRPLATSALTDPSGVPAWKTIPSWDIIGMNDRVVTPAEQLFMAHRAGSHITEVSAPHLSMISDPGVVARVIIQAAQATG